MIFRIDIISMATDRERNEREMNEDAVESIDPTECRRFTPSSGYER